MIEVRQVEKDKKIELECDYCGVLITENDYKCPNCGANCTNKIKQYKKQQEQYQEDEIKRNVEYSRQLTSEMMGSMNRTPLVFAGVAIFMIIFSFVMFSQIMSRSGSSVFTNNSKYNSSVRYNEVGENADCTVQLDSYELYSYVSDRYPSGHNTPDGYQKIAFHFMYQNKRNMDTYLSGFTVRLKADGYKVEKSELKVDDFERVETGKGEYISILNTTAGPSEKIQGYVGYLVPMSAKELVFTFDGVTITMENPVYQEN